MSGDPGYEAQVVCNQTMKGRASEGKGTRNDAKALCVGWVGDALRVSASADVRPLAACILDAADESAAQACRARPSASAP